MGREGSSLARCPHPPAGEQAPGSRRRAKPLAANRSRHARPAPQWRGRGRPQHARLPGCLPWSSAAQPRRLLSLARLWQGGISCCCRCPLPRAYGKDQPAEPQTPFESHLRVDSGKVVESSNLSSEDKLLPSADKGLRIFPDCCSQGKQFLASNFASDPWLQPYSLWLHPVDLATHDPATTVCSDHLDPSREGAGTPLPSKSHGASFSGAGHSFPTKNHILCTCVMSLLAENQALWEQLPQLEAGNTTLQA
ncbi:uncharacterized protein LOC123378094 [Mauremys mutica]|uniref:uncharacterized protein LOC123378094 n=1 Tax=Mauremys mutica TaxID=74926 RepID=UPI001D13F4E8|nr:uncharacterized protein LOC123378094 [Mauremys mutica]